MDELNQSLTNYLLHEGEVDGKPAIALLQTGRGFTLGHAPTVSAHPSAGGYLNLKLEGEGRSIELCAVDTRLIQLVLDNGLYVIYQDERGESQTVHCSVV